jgi:hypothetical protein
MSAIVPNPMRYEGPARTGYQANPDPTTGLPYMVSVMAQASPGYVADRPPSTKIIWPVR